MRTLHLACLLYAKEIYAPFNNRFNGIVERDGTVVGIAAPEGSKYAFVVIRGSDDATDWQRNFDTTTYSHKHRGFMEASNSIDVAVRNLISDYGHGRSLVFVGHSLGGALAQFQGEEHVYSGPLVVTFGSPRVRTQPSSRWVEHHRFVAEGDPVPAVPLALMGYRHSTMPRVLTEGGVKARFGFMGRLRTFCSFGRWGRRAHSIDNYIRLFHKS